MEISPQHLVNGVLGLLVFFASWIFKHLWEEIKSLKDRTSKNADNHNVVTLLLASEYAKKVDVDSQLTKVTDKVTRLESIEVILANQYVTKADFNRICEQLISKLDRIDEKLDNKADK